MKKLMFTLALVSAAFTSAQAQKQLGGEHNIEVAFAPFGGNPINASTLKYRNFMDDDRALRVTLGLNNTTNKYRIKPALSQSGSHAVVGCASLFSLCVVVYFGLV